MVACDPLTLAGIVGRWAVDKPDFTVLTVEGAGVREDETRTYAELWDKGRSLAAGLHRLGLKPGDMVGTLLANHAEFVDLMVASSLLGIAIVPIDPRTRGDRLRLHAGLGRLQVCHLPATTRCPNCWRCVSGWRACSG